MGRYRIWFTERKSIVVEASDSVEALEAADALLLPGVDIEEVEEVRGLLNIGEEVVDARTVLDSQG